MRHDRPPLHSPKGHYIIKETGGGGFWHQGPAHMNLGQ